MYIEKINGPADVKKLTLEELPVPLQCIMYLNHQRTRSCTMYHTRAIHIRC